MRDKFKWEVGKVYMIDTRFPWKMDEPIEQSQISMYEVLHVRKKYTEFRVRRNYGHGPPFVYRLPAQLYQMYRKKIIPYT